jgi:hypothetical protein
MTYTRNLLRMAFLILAYVSAGSCQAPASTPKAKPVSPLLAYAGDWTASLNGTVWLRLRLEMRGDELIGAVLRSRKIEVSDSGEIRTVSDEQAGEKVTSAEVNPDGLLLKTIDAQTQEANRYAMKLVPPANDTADIKLIGMSMPPGMPKPKPWRVTKSNSTPGEQ